MNGHLGLSRWDGKVTLMIIEQPLVDRIRMSVIGDDEVTPGPYGPRVCVVTHERAA
jgi:hypothetical protein